MRVAERDMSEVTRFSIEEALAFFEGLAHAAFQARQLAIGERAVKEVLERLRFLTDVGLSYLTLGPERADARGGRGATDSARDADRLGADGLLVRARRAVDRAAPAG